MIALLINKKELYEIESLVKLELDAIIIEVEKEQMSPHVKRSLLERYKILLMLLKKVSPTSDWVSYNIPNLAKDKRN